MKSFRTAIETENFLMAASDVSMIAVLIYRTPLLFIADQTEKNFRNFLECS